jgi:hypothetical protein
MTSIEQAEKLKKVTDAIVSNLAIIDADEHDLDALENQTTTIVTNLETIRESEE